jgi:DNA primase
LDKRALPAKNAAAVLPEDTHEPEARPELLPVLRDLQQSLAGSLGEQYLQVRHISPALAESLGVGYAVYGKWPHMKDGRAVRQWKWGRLVFPHTNMAGEVVNLYGRAVGRNEKVPKAERHDHLSYPKGVFNAKALCAETVFICEGVFNALSLIEAGQQNACAIFGVYGLRWEWVKARRLVFCLDQDTAGQTAWHELAWEGTTRGLDVYCLPAEVYGGYKDLNEVWAATGKLDVGQW